MSGRSHLASYGDMFNEIVSIVSHDYAGCDGCKDRNDPYSGSKISLLNSRSFHGDDHEFLRLARYYLGCLGDPNLRLIKTGSDARRDWSVGFDVRAAEDCLYVTDVWGDERLEPGDRIAAIDTLSLAEFRKDARRNVLYGDVPEREMWGYFLQYASSFEVVRPGVEGSRTLKPKHNPVDARSLEGSEPVLLCKQIDEDTVYLRVDSLEDADEVAGLVFENEGLLRRAERVILDLRRCRGGSFEGIEPLMPFLIDVPESFSDFMGNLGLYYRYSAGNCERMVHSIQEQAELEEWPEEEADAEVERIEALSNEGLVWEEAQLPDEWMVPVEPPEGAERVIVLSDIWCRNEGEQLLAACSRQQKCTIVGRPSLGSSDYQELFTVSFDDDILFVYPVAMTGAAEAGKGILGKGVPVDVHVPWTPREIDEDVVLEEALKA